MAISRENLGDMVFVTNEYFESFGISRQTLRYRVKRGDVRPIGTMKGLTLYRERDAKRLVLDWAIHNKREVASW